MLEADVTWRKLSFFISSAHSQNYLLHCYKSIGISDAEKRSFENCYPFMYYLEHGKNYYELAKTSPFSIKPVLLFYGMIQLLKACLLTVDPNYPESTSVLAHGVTTRKLKKQSYEFLRDEVKIQKNGLFTHIAEHMFHIRHLEAEKYTMGYLLEQIAELTDLFSYSKNSPEGLPVKRLNDDTVYVPIAILDRYHMTKERFIQFLQSNFTHLNVTYVKEDKNSLYFLSPSKAWNGLYCSPLTYDFYTNTYYMPMSRDDMNRFPELLAHYLLLYNLSMISRYETEWWSDLLHSYATEDYPFVHQFLSISCDKVPYYIYLFLENKLQYSVKTTKKTDHN